jgi:hypothetical protein
MRVMNKIKRELTLLEQHRLCAAVFDRHVGDRAASELVWLRQTRFRIFAAERRRVCASCSYFLD